MKLIVYHGIVQVVYTNYMENFYFFRVSYTRLKLYDWQLTEEGKVETALIFILRGEKFERLIFFLSGVSIPCQTELDCLK